MSPIIGIENVVYSQNFWHAGESDEHVIHPDDPN